MIHLRPLGDRAVLATFATEAEAARWAGAIRVTDLPGVLDVSLAYVAVAVHADPDQVQDWEAWVESLRSVVVNDSAQPGGGRTLRIPVWYGGADLAAVARAIGGTEAEVVALHSGRDYQVFAVGFQPGFPYAGYLPAELSGLPRRISPRPRVPPGSVAIAGRQTGIYPGESPGGWHLLGQTPCRIVDLANGIFPIEPGDCLRFTPITRIEFDRLRPLAPGPMAIRSDPESVQPNK